MEEDKKQSQKYPEDKYKSFEEIETGRTSREAAGKGIGRLNPNIGVKFHETKTGKQFFQIKEPEGERWTDEYYKAIFDTCFTQMGKKGNQDICGKGSSGHVE